MHSQRHPLRLVSRVTRPEVYWHTSVATRSNSTRAYGREDESFDGWRVRSPKDLYDHLSQYIVGQERAKRTLSVAVFNHYHRIAPRLPPREPPSLPSRPQPPPIILDHPVVAPPSPRSLSQSPSTSRQNTVPRPESSRTPVDPPIPWDPSTAGSSLSLDDDGWRRDATRVTGAGADGADPTLTHDLLTLRSREGQWARDGYFSSRAPPPTPSLLGQAMKRRKNPASSDAAGVVPDSSRRNGATSRKTANAYDGFVGGRYEPTDERMFGDAMVREMEQQQHQEQEEKEAVVIEKSNVLMIGPTGTGKTLLARTLAKILDVPFASCDATTYTQAGYVGEDVENCVLRLLQAADYDVNRTEIGIIHIDEIDKLARRGGGEFGSWGGGRDVGGEGVQQALLRLLEGTTLTLSAKPPAISSSTTSGSSGSSSTLGPGGTGSGGSANGPKAESGSSGGSGSSFAAYGDPPGWDPNNPMNRGLGGKRTVREGLPGFSSGGGSPTAKGETFVVDTSNILFVLSGAFVGLDTMVNRRLGKGSIGFGAPLPTPTVSDTPNPLPLKGLQTTDLATYGLIPEFLGRLPILSTLHPLSIDDLVRILTEPKNALIKQYIALFEKYGSELTFTRKAVRALAKEGLERGGGARGLRGVLEELLVDAMFEVPGSSVRYCLITEAVVQKDEPAIYFSRGQRPAYLQAIEDEDGAEIRNEQSDAGMEDEPQRLRATG